MKKATQLLFMLCIATIANAQYYYLPYTNNPGQNPGGLNVDSEYPYGGGLTTGWARLDTGDAVVPRWSNASNIPFSFNFNGNNYTQYKVSTSGVLTFDLAAVNVPAYSNSTLPNATIPDNSLMIWGISGNGTNDEIVVKTFGTAPNRQHWIFFSSYTAPGTTCYVYWSIVLEETTNKIYVVDQRNGGCTQSVTIGLQYSSTSALSVSGSPNINNLSGTNFLPVDNQYYEFVQGSQASYDLTVSNITTSPYLPVGSNNITGVIRNLGVATITSLDLNYTINSGSLVTTSLTGISIAPLASYSFSHNIPWVSSSPGTYIANCYASNPNGNADQNTANDAFSKTLNILLSIEQRIPLFEIFTSSTCPPCQPGNVNFHNIIDPIPPLQHVYIKYQQDFPGTGDPYTTVETLDKRYDYGINSIPRMENDGGWDGNANSFTLQLYNDARAIPAQYMINGEYTEDTVARTYSAKIRYSPLFNASNTVLYTGILENTTSLNIKTNGETEFYQVLKKLLPDENGIILNNITPGSWDSVSISYTFNGSYRLPTNGQAANIIDLATEHTVEEFGDLMMVAWAQAPGTGVPRQVFQAANLTKLSSTGVFEMSKSINAIDIYPNPATDKIKIDVALTETEDLKIILIDMHGKSVEVREITGAAGVAQTEFSTRGLDAGVYHVAVTDSKKNSFVKRIVVVK